MKQSFPREASPRPTLRSLTLCNAGVEAQRHKVIETMNNFRVTFRQARGSAYEKRRTLRILVEHTAQNGGRPTVWTITRHSPNEIEKSKQSEADTLQLLMALTKRTFE